MVVIYRYRNIDDTYMTYLYGFFNFLVIIQVCPFLLGGIASLVWWFTSWAGNLGVSGSSPGLAGMLSGRYLRLLMVLQRLQHRQDNC